MQSSLSHLECPKCSATYEADAIAQLCRCGGPLLARYDLASASATFTRDSLSSREPSLWRYTEILPVRHASNRISLGERFTPILPMRRIGASLDIEALLLKDEGALPTGSFKARGASVGISRAHELGVTSFGMPTNGNAGGAWAAYAARAGIQAYIVMPLSAPVINRLECAMAGAQLYLVDGLIGDAGGIVGKAVAEFSLYDASTLKEPYRIEGKKTIGLELFEQLAWTLPDVIVYPTGGGVGLIGIYKAFLELREMGLIDTPLPRFVAVQADGCAPIVKAWKEGKRESEPWPDANTVAFGITVPKALGDFLVLDTLYATKGCAISVSDESILEMQRRVTSEEGVFVCPEGAATVVAAGHLRQRGWIHAGERVLSINTGTGLKYPDVPYISPPLLQRGDALCLDNQS